MAAVSAEEEEEDRWLEAMGLHAGAAGRIEEMVEEFMEAKGNNDGATQAQVLNRMAYRFQEEERRFRASQPDLFSRDREGFPIWDMCEVVARTGRVMFLHAVFTAVEQRRDDVLQAAAGRLLAAGAPGLANVPSLQHSLFMELLTQDTVEDKVFAWVDAGALPMCCYGAGLLAFSLLDDACADETVRRGLVPKMLRRLRGIVYEDAGLLRAAGAGKPAPELHARAPPPPPVTRARAGALGAAGAEGEGGEGEGSSDEAEAAEEEARGASLGGAALLELETLYLVQGLGVLMSYKECLAAALQEGALDIVLRVVERRDAPVLVHEALRMLAALLSHRKFSLVFIEAGGLKRLLPLPDMAYYASSAALCLMSMTHFRGVVDRLVRLSEPDPAALVSFALGLLEAADEVASSNVLQLLSKVLADPAFLRPFDALGGAKLLLKTARQCIEDAHDAAGRPAARGKTVAKWCCLATRNYLRTHLLLAAQQLDRPPPAAGAAAAAGADGGPAGGAAPLRRVTPDAEDAAALACIAIERKGRAHDPSEWAAAVEALVSGGGLELLLEALLLASGLRLAEVAVYALQALQVVVLLPSVRTRLLGIRLDSDDAAASKSGMRVLVDAGGGQLILDGQVMVSGLQLLCTCVGCSPPPFNSRALHARSGKAAHPETVSMALWDRLHWDQFPPNKVVARVWAQLQDCDGIRILSGLLRGSDRTSREDGVRALACRALLGLSHEPRVRQILQETQLALALSELVRQDPKQRVAVRDCEAAAFRLAAAKLVSLVTGRAQHSVLEVASDSALRKIEKAAVVEASCIDYDRRELLALVHAHLLSSGLPRAAAALREEAALAGASPAGLSTPGSAARARAPPASDRAERKRGAADAGLPPAPPVAARGILRESGAGGCAGKELATPGGAGGGVDDRAEGGGAESRAEAEGGKAARHLGHADGAGGAQARDGEPGRARRGVAWGAGAGAGAGERAAPTPRGGERGHGSKDKLPRENSRACRAAARRRGGTERGRRGGGQGGSTLDKICRAYLRQRHSESTNPIEVLPPLSLAHAEESAGHQGPGIGPPRHALNAPTNLARRLVDRERRGGWAGRGGVLRHGGLGGASLQRQYIYSRFKPLPRPFSDAVDGAPHSELTTGCFLDSGANWPSLLIGSRSGALSRFNFDVQAPAWELQAHNESVSSVAAMGARGAWRVLTASDKEARLWQMDAEAVVAEEPLLAFPDCGNASLSHARDRVAGAASGGRTLLFDAETGALLTTLQEALPDGSVPARALRHRRAAFAPDDETVLCGGVLWDPRTPGECIHKFDRFAHYGGGSFHPSRPEVIISAAVWDIRMSFKLLRWCPSLDQMHTVFSPTGDAIYGFLKYFEEETRGSASRIAVRKYKHMFRTVDATTYADIHTVETKENVADLFVDETNELLAIMEASKSEFAGGGIAGTTCRLYEVGRVRASRSDDEDEEEESEGEEEDADAAGGGREADMAQLEEQLLQGNPQGLAMLNEMLDGDESDGGSDGDGDGGVSDSDSDALGALDPYDSEDLSEMDDYDDDLDDSEDDEGGGDATMDD